MRLLADLPTPKIEIFKCRILENDMIHGFDLQKVKKYMRIDGTFEDDVLELMLIACIMKVEELNNVSLTGKLIEVILIADRIDDLELIKPYLPYLPICEVQSYERFQQFHCIVYETQRDESPIWFAEVCNLMLKMYEERGKQPSKKALYL